VTKKLVHSVFERVSMRIEARHAKSHYTDRTDGSPRVAKQSFFEFSSHTDNSSLLSRNAGSCTAQSGLIFRRTGATNQLG